MDISGDYATIKSKEALLVEQVEMFPGMEMAVKVVMGLDLSLRSTGIVVLGKDRTSQQGRTIGYSFEKATREEKICRWLNISEEILGVMAAERVESVALEHYAFGANLWRGSLLAELGSVVVSQIYLKTGLVPYYITPKTVRSYLLGEGKFDKEDVRSFFEKKGYKLANNDEYDACAIAWMLWDYENGNRDKLTKRQVEYLSRFRDIGKKRKDSARK